MRQSKIFVGCVLVSLVAAAFLSCLRNDGVDIGADNGRGSPNGQATQRVATIRPRLVSAAATDAMRSMAVGGAPADSVKSLKYFVKSVQVCEKVETSGSASSAPQGCLSIYAGDQQAFQCGPTEDLARLGDEAATRTDGFVDLIDPTERLGFAQPLQLTSRDVRNYEGAIITLAPVIKITASVVLSGGAGTLYTHGGKSMSSTGGTDNQNNYFTVPTKSLFEAPAEEAIVVLANGANQVRFQAPLSITAADVDAGTPWVVDLVFNPDGVVSGFSGDQNKKPLSIYQTAGAGGGGAGFTIPQVDFVTISHPADHAVIRESYLGSLDIDGNKFYVRVELYFIEGDTNETIYGAHLTTIVSPQSTSLPKSISKIQYINKATDGTVTLESWNRTAVVTKFVRGRTAGDQTKGFINCVEQGPSLSSSGQPLSAQKCPSSSIEVTFTLKARGLLTDTVPSVAGPGTTADGGTVAGARDGGTADGSAELPDIEDSAAPPTEAGPTPEDPDSGEIEEDAAVGDTE